MNMHSPTAAGPTTRSILQARVAIVHSRALRPWARNVTFRPRRLAAQNDAAAAQTYDVVVIGAGMAGGAFARQLVPKGVSVLLVDAGAQNGKRPGWHMKNSYKFQKDLDSFASHIRSALHTLSVPIDTSVLDTLDPQGFNPLPDTNLDGYVRGNQNPYQKREENLAAAAATYAVGGMATHWTAACPRPHPELEADFFFPHADSYDKAEELLNVNQDTFIHDSVRDEVLNEVLKEAYVKRMGDPDPVPVPGSKYKEGPQPLPLAAKRNPKNRELVTWTGVDTVLGDDLIKMHAGGVAPAGYGRFDIMDNTVCKRIMLDESGTKVTAAKVFDSANNEMVLLHADTFVIAAGSVLTPQILWASMEQAKCGSAKNRLPALGHYLTEQPMAFCQVVWRTDIILDKFMPRYNGNPNDVIPIRPGDPEPNQWIPVSRRRPWHAQIHRDAFAYGDTGPNVDGRMIVDLRFFGIVEQHYYNHVEFQTCSRMNNDAKRGVHDVFEMPQPTFHYTIKARERAMMHDMMEDMVYYATKIGAFLPGSEPQFVKPGLTLHIHGTTRVGLSSKDSVVNRYGKVHGMQNLYLGGNGLIPRAIACNPTVTNVAYAIESSANILRERASRRKTKRGAITEK